MVVEYDEYIGWLDSIDEFNLEHYGTLMESGRYPWGSGENPYQRLRGSTYQAQMAQVTKYKKSGMAEADIAKLMGMSVSQLRSIRSVAKEELKAADVSACRILKEKGWSNQAIGDYIGRTESTVRNYLKPSEDAEKQTVMNVSNYLKDQVGSKKFIDVGRGVAENLGITETKLKAAVNALEQEGYVTHQIKFDQIGTDYKTTMKVLAPPGTTWADVMKNKGAIQLPYGVYFEDNGRTSLAIRPPVSVDPKRVAVRYAEDGGVDMDGVMLLKRGVEDLTLGQARYAQVRVQVGDGHYLKGMAMYADPDQFPPGCDILFNTNKSKGTPMLGGKDNTVLKNLKDEPDNPFGAVVRQFDYDGADGQKHQSPLNIVNEEGDWATWSKTLSSQFLSKQPAELVKERLSATYKDKADEFDEICKLTNPAVKQKLLEDFADGCDAAAVHLKAKGLPGQASKVILPFPDMKETEIYAPGLANGTSVALVRFPHAGTFEIPRLTVNNNNASAKKNIPNAVDAVGIHPAVARQLSGADFDGDTVLVIPDNEGRVLSRSPLKELQNFDPSSAYPAYPGMPKVGKDTGFLKQQQMGSVSNLITDMTLQGAPDDEVVRAVKHSMVIIDAEKHNLNWRQSAEDQRIDELKTKYQGAPNAGAATLISRASGRQDVPHMKQRIGITRANTNPETGEKIITYTGETYRDREGVIKPRVTHTTKMGAVDDARALLSANPEEKELAYADYANKMKALANRARKEYFDTPNLIYSPEAKVKYKDQVDSLNAKLVKAKQNSPLERQAQIYANLTIAAKKRANPDMDKDEVKKLKSQALKQGRLITGAHKDRITIDDDEWEAIQAGAISHSKLKDILNNCNMDSVRSRATPKSAPAIPESKRNRVQAMLASNKYTVAEIADSLGISVSSIYNIMQS